MTMVSRQQLWFSALTLALTVTAAAAQTLLPSYGPGLTVQSLASPNTTFASLNIEPPAGDNAQLLLDFKDSDIKFNLQSLMEILRDHKHEGWVLAAYPDPNTNRPLIGAGFSLDVEATPHPQRDPLNPHPFVEPSSAELWQAAGLPPDRLQQILADFERDQARCRRKRIAIKYCGRSWRRSSPTKKRRACCAFPPSRRSKTPEPIAADSISSADRSRWH